MIKKTSAIWVTSKDDLENIVRESDTISSILRKLGYNSITGTIFKSVKQRIAQDGIDISHISLGLNNNKGKSRGPRPKIPLSDILVENSTYADRQEIKKRIVREGMALDVCEVCGLGSEWNGKPLTLQLDHKNGVSNDNRIDNLRIICPNCHTQTETFCGSNTRQSKKIFCSKCGARCSNKNTTGYCKKCAPRNRASVSGRLANMDARKLSDQVQSMPKRDVAKLYGVSDRTIGKWCEKLNIECPPIGHWVKIKISSGEFKPYTFKPEDRAVGEKTGSAKLTDEDVIKISSLRNSGYTYGMIVKEMGSPVTKSMVARICSGKSWAHVTSATLTNYRPTTDADKSGGG